MDDALFAARIILEEITPLKTDCGRICGAACCHSLEGEETGMLLFPGEEILYENQRGWRLQKTETGEKLLICPGKCDRTERPLSCRIFPLLPVYSGGKIAVQMDLRARSVCPLCRMGIQALNPTFSEAVKEAGETLAADERIRIFLEKLSREQEEMRQLRRVFRTKHASIQKDPNSSEI